MAFVKNVNFLRNLVYFLESDYSSNKNKLLDEKDAKQFIIRNTILRAIASHDCNEIYYLKVFDFAFLLAIFDEMQEWGRPRFKNFFVDESIESELKINKFNEKEVSYSIPMYSNIEKQILDEEKYIDNAYCYFIRKSKKIRSILRSAAYGDLRQFELSFEVSINIGQKPSSYKIIHKRSDDISIYIDNKICEWEKLLNDFVKCK